MSLLLLAVFGCGSAPSGPAGLVSPPAADGGAADTGLPTDGGDGGADTGDGGGGDTGTATDTADGGADSGDGGADTGESDPEAEAEALRVEMGALLAAEPGCQAAGDAVPEHDPSWERGLWFSPEGGSEYDPRLAGCFWRSRDLSGAVTDHEAHYDDLGRRTDSDRTSLGKGDPHSYIWSDDGCLQFDTSFTGSGRAYVKASVCDDHGYVLCEADSMFRDITKWTNTYTDDLLTQADDGYNTNYFAWEDGRVVDAVYWGSTYYHYEYTWDVDLIVERILTMDDGMGPDVTTWTYDDARRMVASDNTYGGFTSGTSTWDYDGDAVWPYQKLEPGGAVVYEYEVECP